MAPHLPDFQSDVVALVVGMGAQGVVVGIEQVEAVAHVADAAVRRCLLLWIDMAVEHREEQGAAPHAQLHVDVAVVGRRDAVFERVLHKRDKDHRCHGRVGVVDVVARGDVGGVAETQLLQVDILLQVVCLLAHGNEVAVGVVVSVLTHIDELLKGLLALVGVGEDETIERVERVEEEMRIDLSLVHGQFGLVALRLHLLSCPCQSCRLHEHVVEETEAEDDQEQKPHRRLDGRPVLGRGRALVVAQPYRKTGEERRDAQRQQQIDDAAHVMAADEESGDVGMGECLVYNNKVYGDSHEEPWPRLYPFHGGHHQCEHRDEDKEEEKVGVEIKLLFCHSHLFI